MKEYLDELECRTVGSFFNVGYAALPMPTQYSLQKKVSAAQKGTVVTLPSGEKFDARDVKNGTGGRKNHRENNNRLNNASATLNLPKDKYDEEKQLEEALKLSMAGIDGVPDNCMESWVDYFDISTNKEADDVKMPAAGEQIKKMYKDVDVINVDEDVS